MTTSSRKGSGPKRSGMPRAKKSAAEEMFTISTDVLPKGEKRFRLQRGSHLLDVIADPSGTKMARWSCSCGMSSKEPDPTHTAFAQSLWTLTHGNF